MQNDVSVNNYIRLFITKSIVQNKHNQGYY